MSRSLAQGTQGMLSTQHSQSELQLKRARGDLETALRGARPARVEEFLDANPALAADRDALLELIYTEYVVRADLGQSPAPDEYYERFPTLAADLEEVFQVHEELEKTQSKISGLAAHSGTQVAEEALSGRIAGYEILNEIGRGGMGVVYRARQLKLDRVVALKVILAGVFASKKERERFQLEAEAAARLDHPNIVRIHEIGEHQGRPFCVMEYVAGGNLADRLNGTPWHPKRSARLISIVARAAQQAHERGIVHRDLKPANILLAPTRDSGDLSQESATLQYATHDSNAATLDDCQPKITDFGLAKRISESAQGPTHTGDFVGTPAYMAPEQAAGRSRQVGPATDVWSLGAMLYELLTGRPAFDGASAIDTMQMVQQVEPVPPRRLRARLPRDLETICLKCLNKAPAGRYATAQALADDLDRWLSGDSIHARPTSAPARALRWAVRRPALAALLVALAVAVVGGFVGIYTQWRRAESLVVLRQKERDAAVDAHLRAEANNARAREILFRLVELARDMGDFRRIDRLQRSIVEDTLDFHRQFLNEQPQDPAVRLGTAEAAYRVARARSADDFQDRGEAAITHAVALADELVREFPDEPKYRRLLAGCLLLRAHLLATSKRFDQGVKEFERGVVVAQQLFDQHPTDSEFTALLPTILVDMAHMYWLEGDAATAEQLHARCIRAAGEALQHDPKANRLHSLHALALHRHGWLLWLRGAKDKAESELKEAFAEQQALVNQKDPHREYIDELAWSHFRLAQVEQSRDQTDQADEHFNEGVRLLTKLTGDYPAVRGYNRNLVIFLNEYIKFSRARGAHLDFCLSLARRKLDALQNLLAVQGDNPDLQRETAAACSEVGAYLSALGRSYEAREMCFEALRIAPNDPAALNNAAWVLSTVAEPELRDPPRAVALAQQAATAVPNTASFQNTLGVAYYRADRFDDAISALSKAASLRKGSESPVDCFFLAMAHHRRGETKEARTFFERGKSLYQSLSDPSNYLRRFLDEATQLLSAEAKD